MPKLTPTHPLATNVRNDASEGRRRITWKALLLLLLYFYTSQSTLLGFANNSQQTMAPTRRRSMVFRSQAFSKKLDLLRSIKSAPAVVGEFYIPPPRSRYTSHKTGAIRLPSFHEQPIIFRVTADSLAAKLEWYLCRLGSLDLTLVMIKKMPVVRTTSFANACQLG
jgi:hypothetical protein